MEKTIIIGTRGSDLALYQAQVVANLLKEAGYSVTEKIISTRGDLSSEPLEQMKGDGFFTKELEKSLLSGEIDIAVHSCKDLPSIHHYELPWAPVSSREAVHDVLIINPDRIFWTDVHWVLREGSKIGTSSPRRKAQFKKLFPSSHSVDVRGNVPTRLQKVAEGQLDGVILAGAGIKRLKLENKIKEHGLALEDLPWTTAPCQGIIAAQVHESNSELLDKISNQKLKTIVEIEKSILSLLGGGCHLAVGAEASMMADELKLDIFYSEPETGKIFESKFLSDNPRDLVCKAFSYLCGIKSQTEHKGRVWLTQPIQHQLKAGRLLAKNNFYPISWPQISAQPTWKASEFIRISKRLDKVSSLAFGSAIGAQWFLNEWIDFDPDYKILKSKKIFVVGHSVKDCFSKVGITTHPIPFKQTAKNLFEEIRNNIKDGEVLIVGTPHSKLFEYLKSDNLPYDFLEIYKSGPSNSFLSQKTQLASGDSIVFTSPSGVRSFFKRHNLSELPKNLNIISFGPTTSKSLNELKVNHVSNTVSGSWDTLINLLNSQN